MDILIEGSSLKREEKHCLILKADIHEEERI